MREYTGPTKTNCQVAFVPSDPPLLAAVSLDCAYLWQLGHPEPAAVLPWKEEDGGDPELLVSPDGRWLVVGPLSRLYCWDLSTIPPGQPRPMPVADLVTAAFRSPADRLAIVYKRLDDATRSLWTGEISLSDLDQFEPRCPKALRLTSELRTPLFGPYAARYSRVASFAPNMSRLALSAHIMPVHLWETESRDPPRRIPLNGVPGAYRFLPRRRPAGHRCRDDCVHPRRRDSESVGEMEDKTLLHTEVGVVTGRTALSPNGFQHHRPGLRHAKWPPNLGARHEARSARVRCLRPGRADIRGRKFRGPRTRVGCGMTSHLAAGSFCIMPKMFPSVSLA